MQRSQTLLALHTGVVPVHAADSAVVHCTHVFAPMTSHTGISPEQS